MEKKDPITAENRKSGIKAVPDPKYPRRQCAVDIGEFFYNIVCK